MTFFDDFEIQMPTSWIERPNQNGLQEYWACSDGSAGVLQLSKLPDALFERIAQGIELGGLAARFGKHLGGAERSWGRCGGLKQGMCALGRFGFAIFQGGAQPAMLVWLAASNRAALLWTWRGPNLLADEIGEAFQVVLNTRHSLSYRSPRPSSGVFPAVDPR